MKSSPILRAAVLGSFVGLLVRGYYHRPRPPAGASSDVGSGNRLSFQASGLHAVVDWAIEAILER